MKYLIVGLGNIGDEYHETRHNIGFMILDELSKQQEIKFKSDRLADICTAKAKGRTLLLIKPTTYMNLSGKAVKYWMDKEKIPLENVLILVDDLALPFGQIRMRSGGSDAGHNGLKSINESLSSQAYSRLRFGIGNDYPKGRQADYVLSKFSSEEQKILPERIKIAIDVILSFSFIGIQQTMNQFNNK